MGRDPWPVFREEEASQELGGDREAENSWVAYPPPLIFVSRGNKGLTGRIVVSKGNKGVRGFWRLDEDLGRSEQAKKRSPDMTMYNSILFTKCQKLP